MRIKSLLAGILPLFFCLLVSCSYDDTEIKSKIDDLDSRVKQLETQVAQMNKNISSYLTTVEALEAGDRILSVDKFTDDTGSGYIITFSKTGTIKVYNGKDGSNGDDGQPGTPGHSPVIGVKQFTDGVYYWTVDGEYLLDGEGNKIAATAHISTPRVQLSADGKHYEISFDNGETWLTVGDVAGTSNSPTVFAEVVDGADSVTFYLTEGGTIVIPKVQPFALNIENTQIGIKAGQTVFLSYSVTGADEGTVVDGIADNGYKVVVTGNANAGGIEVTAPDPLVNGKAIIVAVNSKGTTSAKILSFEEGQLMLIAEGTSVGADEATVMVMVMTNLNYNVNIPNAAKSWISLIETKSMRNELLTFKIEKNTGSARSATIKLEDSGKNVLQSFTIEQAAGEGSSETEDSGLIIDDWEYETPISL